MSSSVNRDLLSIAEAAQRIPGRPSAASVYRWAQKGTKGLKLPTIRCGGRYFVDPDDLCRFIARMQLSEADRLAEEGC